MGLNNWWNAGRKANEFLSTGVFNEVVLNSPDPEPFNSEGSTNRCTTTSDCASGYACVNGQCLQTGVGGSTGGGISASPGQCDPNDPNDPQPNPPGAGGCNQGGSNSCQGQANCGDGYQARECCGTRTCSFSAFGVACVCDGDIKFKSPCSEFCDSYMAANGEPGAGCTEDNACGECNECENSECVPKADGPCWCDGGETCNTDGCYQCVSDPEDPDFGECRFTEEDCYDCGTVTNYLCPCNRIIPFTRFCQPYGTGGMLAINVAQQMAAAQCAELCDDDTVCDCNCDNDCADCEYCSSAGVCEPDPECEAECGRWVFRGQKTDNCGRLQDIEASFIQGGPDCPDDGDSGRCNDGGCYAVMGGASVGFEGTFEPTGLQEQKFGESIVVTPVADNPCRGSTFGCGIDLYDSNDEYVRNLVLYTKAFCVDPANDCVPAGVSGCITQGTWTFETFTVPTQGN